MKRGSFFVSLLMAAVCVLAFQNCSQGFSVADPVSKNSSLSNLPTNSNVTDTTPSTGSSSGSSSGSTGGSTGGGGSATPSISFTENNSAAALSTANVAGGPAADSVLQRNSAGQGAITLKTSGISASYYSSKLISNGVATAVTSPGFYSSGMTLNFNVVTGLKSSQLQVSFYNSAGLEIQRFKTNAFTVGEVFLIAGQSNSAGHGESPQTAAQTLNKALDPETGAWVAMRDPLPYATNWGNVMYGSQSNPGGSPWPAMSDQLSSVLGVPVAVVSVGWGGSSVQDWVSGNATTAPLIERLVKGATALGNCNFRTVLWHQGESDSVYRTSRAQYKTLLRTLRTTFQSRTGCAQTWLVARASQSTPEANTSLQAIMDIRDAQTDLWSESGFGRGPDTDLMSGATYRFDLLHFSVLGLGIHGRMWANRIGAIFGQTVKIDPAFIPEAQQAYNLYQSVLGRSTADMEIDHDGLYYQTNALQLGSTTLAQLQANLQNSDEAFIRAQYLTLARRYPTFAEIQSYQARIKSGELSTRALLQAALQREVR